MSNRESVISKLKELAKTVLNTDKVELKFTDNKLSDGSIIRYDADDLATGVVVSIVVEDGSVLPLPIGSYSLEDGTTFDVVSEDGTIDNVVTAEEPAEVEDAPAEMEEKQATAEAKQLAKSIVESVVKETRFEAEPENTEEVATTEMEFEKIKKSNKMEFEALNKKVEEQGVLIKEMFKIIEDFGKTDSVDSVETKKNVFKEAKKRLTAKELKALFNSQLK